MGTSRRFPPPSATRHPGSKLPCAAVRLACVRPAASVHSEPGSNSSLKFFDSTPKGFVKALMAVVYPDPNYSITHILRCLFLIHLDCVERLLMDIHPPARRPHKSPAHTVKDHRNRPQRLVPYPTSKPSSEPHILQQIPSPSTPRDIFFCCFRFASG